MSVTRHKSGWRADWRDAFDLRHRAWYKLKEDAQSREQHERAKARAVRSGDAPPPAGDPDVTLAAFVRDVFVPRRAAQGIAPGTIESERSALDQHILPGLGVLRVRAIHRRVARDFLLRKLGDLSDRGRPFAEGTVKKLGAALGAILAEARAEGVIADNPMRGLWRELRRGSAARARKAGPVKALTAAEARRLVEVAPGCVPRAWPALALMLFGGLRAGEAFAVTADRVDLAGRRLLVDRQLAQFGGLRPTKTGEGRRVELSAPLAAVLRSAIEAARQPSSERVVRLDGGALGASAPTGPYLAAPELPEAPSGKQCQALYRRTLEALRRVLKAAGLPQHHGLHSLRHTFGSLHVSRGTSIAWVRAQMGHASIAMTVDVYGSWLPPEAPGAAEGLAAELMGPALGRNREEGEK